MAAGSEQLEDMEDNDDKPKAQKPSPTGSTESLKGNSNQTRSFYPASFAFQLNLQPSGAQTFF